MKKSVLFSIKILILFIFFNLSLTLSGFAVKGRYPWDNINDYKRKCEKHINFNNSKIENEEEHLTSFYRLKVNQKDIKWHFLISTKDKKVIQELDQSIKEGEFIIHKKSNRRNYEYYYLMIPGWFNKLIFQKKYNLLGDIIGRNHSISLNPLLEYSYSYYHPIKISTFTVRFKYKLSKVELEKIQEENNLELIKEYESENFGFSCQFKLKDYKNYLKYYLKIIGYEFVENIESPKVYHVPDYTEHQMKPIKVPHFNEKQSVFTDDEILDAVYSSYKYPENFFKLEKHQESGIAYPTFPDGEFNCNNSIEEAEDFLFKYVIKGSDLQIIKSSESEKYFEFHVHSKKNKKAIDIYRIHRCDYLMDLITINSWYWDRPTKKECVGKIGSPHPNKDVVKEIVESIWSLSFMQIGGSTVLSSFTVENQTDFTHYIFATGFTERDLGLCDRISLIKYKFSVDKKFGEIYLSIRKIRKIAGHCH